MVVSAFFSLIVYRGFVKELGRGFRYQTTYPISEGSLYIQRYGGYTRILPFFIYPEEVAPDEYNEVVSLAKKRFALQLLIINGVILFMAGTAGYFLAGKTLQPIEMMVNDQKRFVADASHELRTPLTSLKTEIEVALRDKNLKTKEAKNLLNSNLEEVNKMKYFSDSLLELSRYGSGGHDFGMENVDLTDIVKQAIKKNLSQAKLKNLKIKKNLQKIIVNGNQHGLVELVSILVNNAIKYSPQKTDVEVTLKKINKHAVIEVADKGIGIDKKDIPHIFDRFYRADSSRGKRDVDGFGLGLSIAKSIVDLHKGAIKVRSKVGIGSIFKVILPL